MDIPENLRAALRRLEETADTKTVVETAKKLSEGYRSKNVPDKPVISDKIGAVSYALSRMPATCAAFCDVFLRVKNELSPTFSSLLDLGAGTGSACHAASLFPEITRITAVEKSRSMIEVGKLLAGGSLSVDWAERDLSCPIPEEFSADLVTAGYLLNEITPSERRLFLLRAWNAAKSALLLIEPGTPDGFSLLCNAKRVLRAEGAILSFPCPKNEDCPLEGYDWCAFSCRVQRSRIHRLSKGGDAPFEDEKYCCALFFRCNPKKDAGEGRIIRHPKIEKGKITFSICDGSSVKSRQIGEKEKAMYKLAKKYSSGDRFPLSGD